MVIKDEGRAARVWALIAGFAGAEAVSVGHVCRAAVPVTGTDGAALSLVTAPDRRTLLHATDGAARRLDDLQFGLGEGPCVDAWRQGGPVLVADLGSVEAMARWPWFAASAVEAGAGALFAFPLQAGAIRPGVLVLYRAQPGLLSDEQLADALVFARAALTVTLDTVGSDGVEGRSTPVASGWLGQDRAEVYQATGMVAVQLDAGLDEALARLRAHAFTTDASLAEIAQQVLDRVLRFTPDGTGGSDAE
ncbi:GAF domain-containing protein [Actinomadura meridiana]|uniref:GAF domain-containing protein n=1 Tax=Actinomadura meridiana TaxID=559626 RepID=A0ABP8BW45_9ACTN